MRERKKGTKKSGSFYIFHAHRQWCRYIHCTIYRPYACACIQYFKYYFLSCSAFFFISLLQLQLFLAVVGDYSIEYSVFMGGKEWWYGDDRDSMYIDIYFKDRERERESLRLFFHFPIQRIGLSQSV